MSSETITRLIKEWREIYNSIDKRTIKAREVRDTIYELSSLVGLV